MERRAVEPDDLRRRIVRARRWLDLDLAMYNMNGIDVDKSYWLIRVERSMSKLAKLEWQALKNTTNS